MALRQPQPAKGPQQPQQKFQTKEQRLASAAQKDMSKLLKNEKAWTGIEGRRAESYRQGREQDLASGRARGEEVFKAGALGRISEGFSPEEQQAMREQNLKAITQGQQAASRNLARQQAMSGVRGPLAAAQQSQQNLGAQGQLADQERQLFLENIANKRAGQQFNIGQGEKELAGRMSTEMGYGSLGAAERAAAMQSVLGDKALLGSKDIARQTKGKK